MPEQEEKLIPEREFQKIPQASKEQVLLPVPKSFFKKFLHLVILVALVSIAGASFYFWNKIVRPDPIPLLPEETLFYLRVKINSENQQVKNFKALLNKFPYYKKLSQKLQETIKRLKDENPPFKALDLTISDEVILAIISPRKKETTEVPLVLIFKNPDLKKIERIGKDIKIAIEESEDWEIEEETYKGRKILKAIPIVKIPSWMKERYPSLPSPQPKYTPSFTFTNGNFFLATEPEVLKKIIDVAEDQKITSLFKKDKVKNITSSLGYQKIKKYFPKDYLLFFYGELNWQEIAQKSKIENIKTVKLFSPFLASLKTAFSFPFLKPRQIEDPQQVAFTGAVFAEKDELKSETYTLDLREKAFLPSQFSFQNSLINIIPEKIGEKEIAFFKEGSDLKNNFENFKENLTDKERNEFERLLDTFERSSGINLEEIFALFNKNFAFFIASKPSNEETPILAFVFDVEDEQKIKEILSEIKIPTPSGLSMKILGEIGFSKELVDDFEIYSLPVSENFGLSFSILNKKLFLTLSKKNLLEILKNVRDSKFEKLGESEIFKEQFEKVPQNITNLSFSYPYGFLGVGKYLVKLFYTRFATIGLLSEKEKQQVDTINEFFDKGIASYLKLLKSFGSFSYLEKENVVITKSRLIFGELSNKEKRETEAFWDNIQIWIAEKSEKLTPPLSYKEEKKSIEEELPPESKMKEYEIFSQEVAYRGSKNQAGRLPIKSIVISPETKIYKIEGYLKAFNRDPEYARSVGIAVGKNIPYDCKADYYLTLSSNTISETKFKLSPTLFKTGPNLITSWVSTYGEWGGIESWVTLKLKFFYSGEPPRLSEDILIFTESMDPISCNKNK